MSTSLIYQIDTAGDEKLLTHESKTNVKLAKIQKNLLTEKPTKLFDKLYANDNVDIASVVATTPLNASNAVEEDADEDEDDYFGLPPPSVDLSKIINESLAATATNNNNSKINESLAKIDEKLQLTIENAKPHPYSKRKRTSYIDHSNFNTTTGKFDDEDIAKVDVAKELSKSIMLPGFEQIKELPNLSKKQQRDLNRLERKKSKGSGWFNLPAQEVTRELKNDLRIIQMRSILDPKHFYKKNDLKVLPKYFQVGTVQHTPLDYYNERHIRKNKKHSIVDEVLADNEIQKFTKRKFKEITERTQTYKQRKALMKMKKLKKKKK